MRGAEVQIKQCLSQLFILSSVIIRGTAASTAIAQPADLPIPPARSDEYPAGVSIAKAGMGMIYISSDGRTLYGLDTRTVHRWATNPALYCKDRCADWEPLLAPAGMKPNVAPAAQGRFGGGDGSPGTAILSAGISRQGPGGTLLAPAGMVTPITAPDWGVMDGPAGPQWVYKGWHMVYVRKGDKPRSTKYDGTDEMKWNTLKYVPPVPLLTAPSGIKSVFRNGAYVLSDKDGRLLYTGICRKDCVSWQPLGAGLASLGLGEWTVNRSTDEPQWLFRGQPVFVGTDADVASLPKSSTLLRP
jgi:predicted lipoprotein with Yx(FWY)xxD motif